MLTQSAPHAAYPYQLPMTREIAHHRHDRPYATLILSGAYEEAGDSGRWRVEAGDVLIHGAFSAHRDGLARRPSMVLDLPLPFSAEFGPCCGRVRDPDAIVAAAANDRAEAADLLIEMMTEDAAAQGDAPDLLARALTHDGAAKAAERRRSKSADASDGRTGRRRRSRWCAATQTAARCATNGNAHRIAPNPPTGAGAEAAAG